MWLKTKDGDLVNMDKVAIVKVSEWGYPTATGHVVAMIQATSNEDYQISAVLFESVSLWTCQEFTRWLFGEMGQGARIADVGDYLAAFQEDDAQ